MKKLCTLITVCLLATSVCLAGGKYSVMYSAGYGPGRTTLTNFPMLVVLSTNRVGFSYAQFASTNGWDLRFYTTSGVELPYEIESWGYVGNSNSYIWVQVPQLTYYGEIRVAWGDASKTQAAYTTNGAVWDSMFAGVWHFGQASTNDSTTNQNNGVVSAGTIIPTNAVTGSGVVFDGSSCISCPHSGCLAITQAMEIATWVNIPTNATELSMVGKGVNVAPYWYAIAGTGTPRPRLYSGDGTGSTGTKTSTTSVTLNAWNYVTVEVFTTNGGVSYQAQHFINGVADTVGARGAFCDDLGQSLYIGADGSGANLFLGAMDELRISSTNRTTNWVWATWYNMASNSVFLQYGSAQENYMYVYTNHNLTAGATIYGTNSVRVGVSKAAEAGGPPYVYNFGNSGSGYVGGLDMRNYKLSGTNLVFDMGNNVLIGNPNYTNFYLVGNSLVVSNVGGMLVGTVDASSTGNGGSIAFGSSSVRVSNDVSLTAISTYSSGSTGFLRGGDVDIYAGGYVYSVNDIDTHASTTQAGTNGYAGKVTINHQGNLTVRDILSSSISTGDVGWIASDMTLQGDGATPGTLTGVLTARNLDTRYRQDGGRAPGKITLSGYTGANISGTVRSSSAGSSNGGDISITNISGYIQIAGAITANSVSGIDGLLNMQTLGSAGVGVLNLSTVSSALFNVGSQSYILGLLSGTNGTPATGLADIGTSLRLPAGQTIRYSPMKNPALNSQTLTLADLNGVAGAGGLLTPADTMFVQTNQDLSSYQPIYGTNSSGVAVAKGLTSSVYDFGSVVTGFVGHLNLRTNCLSKAFSTVNIDMNMGGHNIEGTGTNFNTFRGAGNYIYSAGVNILNVGVVSLGKIDLHQYQTREPTFSDLPAGSLTIGEPTGTGNGPALGSVRIDEIDCSAWYGDGGNVTIYSTSNVLIQSTAGVPGTISTRFRMICNWSDKAGNVTIKHTGSFVSSNIWANCYVGSFRYPQGGNVTLQGNYGGAISGPCVAYDILTYNGLVDGGYSGHINIGGYSSFSAHDLKSLTQSGDTANEQAGNISITNIAGNIQITGTIDAKDIVPAKNGYVRLQTTNSGHIIVANIALNNALYTTFNPSGKAYITGSLYTGGTTNATPSSIGTKIRAPLGKVIYYAGNKSPGLGYRTIRLANEAGTAGAGGLLTPVVNTQTPEYQSILGERTQL